MTHYTKVKRIILDLEDLISECEFMEDEEIMREAIKILESPIKKDSVNIIEECTKTLEKRTAKLERENDRLWEIVKCLGREEK